MVNKKTNKSTEIINNINKKFGKNIIKFASEEEKKERLPYGIPYIDDFTGGSVRGNFVIIYGGESTGKTSLIYHHIATQQKKGLRCCLIDIEHSYAQDRALQLGVDPTKLLLMEKIDYAEQSMDIIIALAKESAVDCIYVDCYDKETEVLTKKGWKYFKDVNYKDLLLSLDSNYKEANYYNVKNIYKQKYKGKMVYYNRRHCNFCMTLNNKILYGLPSSQFFSGWKTDKISDVINSKKYKESIFFKKDFNWKGKNQKYFIFKANTKGIPKSYKIEMNIWLEFLGWYLSEGSLQVTEKGKNNNNFYTVKIHQSSLKHPYFCKEIENVLSKLPFKYNRFKNKFKDFYICNSGLGKELLKYGRYSKDRQVPNYVKNLNSDQIKKFLKSFLKGDGHLTWSGNWKIALKSKKLIDDLQELFLKIGVYASTSQFYQKPKKKWIVDHWVNFGGLFYILTTYQGNNMSHYIRKKNIQLIEYNDFIYDVEVKSPSNLIYIRRKGTCFWASNSIQAMSSRQEQESKQGKERSIEDDETALLARKLSKFFRVAGNPVYTGKVSVILIGQLRTDISKFGGLHSLSGGNALKHTSKQTLFLRKGQKADAPTDKVKEYYFDEKGKERYKTIDKIIGFSAVLKMEKNHLSGGKAEGNELKLPFYFDTGFTEPEKKDETITKGEKDEVDN